MLIFKSILERYAYTHFVGAYDYAPNVVVVLRLYLHLFAGTTAFIGMAKMGRNHTPLHKRWITAMILQPQIKLYMP